LHVCKQAVIHLSCHRPVIHIVAQVGTTEQKLALSHPGFKNQSKVSVFIKIIHHPHDGLQVFFYTVQLNRLGIFANILPLPVTVHFRGEMQQSRV